MGFYQSGLTALAKTAGLDDTNITLCERHIKVYEADAKAHVPPHKDRLASQLTVGIPLLLQRMDSFIGYLRESGANTNNRENTKKILLPGELRWDTYQKNTQKNILINKLLLISIIVNTITAIMSIQ